VAEKASMDWLHREPTERPTELGEFDVEKDEDSGAIGALEGGNVPE